MAQSSIGREYRQPWDLASVLKRSFCDQSLDRRKRYIYPVGRRMNHDYQYYFSETVESHV